MCALIAVFKGQDVHYRILGQTHIKVSVLSFGAWQLGDSKYWGEDNATDAGATVHAAIDNGINLFDTAEVYGDGESERKVRGDGSGYIAWRILFCDYE